VRLFGFSILCFRSHCRILLRLYADAAYCYKPSSVVCRSVCHSSEPCKTAETIEMSFESTTRVDLGNHVLDRGPDPPWEGAILRRGSGGPL